jgi:recombination protein RecA
MSTQPEPPTSPDPDRVIPTGSLALDRALGTGGWPRGRIVELFGPESGGRTTLVLEAIAQAQRCGTAALIDADHATDPESARRLGVDPRGLVLHRGNVLSELIPVVEQFIKRGVDVIAIDSIAAILIGDKSPDDYAHQPKSESNQKVVEQWLKSLLGPLAKSRSVLLVTNQQREKIGVMYGDPATTPWETHPLRDFASVRVEVKRITHLKDGENIVGFEGRLRIVKNRLAVPYRNVEYDVHYDRGIAIERELVALGLEGDVLTQSGQFVRFGDVVIGRTRDDAVRRLQRDEALTERLYEAVVASFVAAPVPPADEPEANASN